MSYDINESSAMQFEIKEDQFYPLHQRNWRESDEDSSLLATVRNYPTTCCLITAIHVLYCYQWLNFTRTKQRQRYSVSYDLLVVKKRFHRIWLALLSHTPQEQDIAAAATTPVHERIETSGQNIPRIPSAQASQNMWSFFSQRQQQTLPTLQQHTTSAQTDTSSATTNFSTLFHQFSPSQTGRNILSLICAVRFRYPNVVAFLHTHVLSGHFSGLPLLLYNTHILWSLRPLEKSMTEQYHDSWYYARMLVLLAIFSVTFELCLIYILLHAHFKRRTGLLLDDSSERQADDNTEASSSTTTTPVLTPSLRLKLQHRPIATCSAISIALLTVWMDYHEVIELGPAPSILPGMKPPLILRNHAVTSCFMTIMMLTFLAGGGNFGNPATVLPWMRIVCAIFAGTLWTNFFYFLGQVQWSAGYTVILFLLCILSAYSDPDSSKLQRWLQRCIQAGPWNRDGHFIFPNDRYYSTLFGSLNDENVDATVSAEERGTHAAATSSSSSSAMEDASGSEEDLAMSGSLVADDSAVESGLQLQQLLPHTMRSRRNRWNPL